MHISDRFDSGNIEVLSAEDPSDVQLAIKLDAGGEHRQWFHFRVSGARGVPLTLRITNAHACSYPKGWDGYRTVASVDRQSWFRVDTSYEDGQLVIRHQPTSDVVTFAYFAPFSLERHASLVAKCAAHPGVRHEVLGQTVEGRDLDLLVLGAPAGTARSLWLIARQHPGESMAAWWMEGFLDRLLDAADPLARQLRTHATLYVVPHMNPDGSFLGHLRTNAAGANLNREWHAPSAERSPEVLAVRNRMDQTGVALCLDVHGDEALPYYFISGAEGIPSLTADQSAWDTAFQEAYCRATPDFQTTHGYPRTSPGKANLTMCTNQVAERYGALAMTLEMPFKDNADLPDPLMGWSPDRAMRLGAAALHPLWEVLLQLPRPA